ncbi:hypothetical protein [Streptomyces sp. NPDC002463]|uniref:hypothetical protein n=1 Tax=Streptomyces sp. NPDC002463 TaxID=3364645 RepID=UPI0036BC7319
MPAPGDGSVQVESSVSRHARRSARPPGHHRLPAGGPPDRRNVRDRPVVAPLPRGKAPQLRQQRAHTPRQHAHDRVPRRRGGPGQHAPAGRRLLPEAAPDLSAAQITGGLAAVIPVKLDRPEFSGSTRGMLAGAAVRASLAQAVQNHLHTGLNACPEQATAITNHITHDTHQN